jgi:catechol 2,3-dioxygenase-like lactoylglutathione lyase family enzyme
VDAEIAFLRAFGASSVTPHHRLSDGVRIERFHVSLGSARLTLFRRGTYDDQLEAAGVRTAGGIAHAAFDVASTDRVMRAAAAHGIAPLIPTFEVEAFGKGPARITYFRSPNGLVLEAKEIVAAR